jgi:Cysteine rich repeat
MKYINRAGLAAVTCLCALSAFAQETPQQASGTVATDCKADLANFCKDVRAGGGRLLACLNTNYDKLSSSCKNALIAAKAVDKAHAGAAH